MSNLLITQIDEELESLRSEVSRLTEARDILNGSIVIGLRKDSKGKRPASPEDRAVALIAKNPGATSRELGIAPLVIAKLSRGGRIERANKKGGWQVVE